MSKPTKAQIVAVRDFLQGEVSRLRTENEIMRTQLRAADESYGAAVEEIVSLRADLFRLTGDRA